MPWMIPAAMLAASAIGAGVQYLGQSNANNANVQMANSANAMNAADNASGRAMQLDMFQAQQNFNRVSEENAYNRAIYMDDRNKQYATDLSNTAYQRATADMRAAGINPLLAYQQGGATSTPVSGSAPGAVSSSSGSVMQGNPMRPATVQNALGAAVSSAFQGAQAVQSIQSAQAQIQQTEAQTRLTGAQERNVDAQTTVNTLSALTEKERARLIQMQGTSEGRRPNLIDAQAGQAGASAENYSARTAQQREETTDYRNWGPPSTPRNLAASAERTGTRAGAASAEAISSLPSLPPSVQRTLDNLRTNPLSGLRDRITRTDGDRSTPLRAMSERLLDLFR